MEGRDGITWDAMAWDGSGLTEGGISWPTVFADHLKATIVSLFLTKLENRMESLSAIDWLTICKALKSSIHERARELKIFSNSLSQKLLSLLFEFSH